MRAANELAPFNPPVAFPPFGAGVADCIMGFGRAPNPDVGGDSDRDEALLKPRKLVAGRASSSSELMSAILRFWPPKDEFEGESMASECSDIALPSAAHQDTHKGKQKYTSVHAGLLGMVSNRIVNIGQRSIGRRRNHEPEPRATMTFSSGYFLVALARFYFRSSFSLLLLPLNCFLSFTHTLPCISQKRPLIIRHGCFSLPHLYSRCPPLRSFGYSQSWRCGLDFCPGQGYSA